MDLDRRDLLTLGGLTVAGAMLGPSTLRAQTAKRGGTLSLRLWDPPHFDPYLNVTYKTQVVYSFTHSRLLKHKVGPSVQPGTFPLEGDLAESWTQPGDTTYVSTSSTASSASGPSRAMRMPRCSMPWRRWRRWRGTPCASR